MRLYLSLRLILIALFKNINRNRHRCKFKKNNSTNGDNVKSYYPSEKKLSRTQPNTGDTSTEKLSLTSNYNHSNMETMVT